MKRCLSITLLGFALWFGESHATTAEVEQQGLLKTVRLANQSEAVGDVEIAPLLATYVPRGEPVSVFLPVSPFEIEWTGYVSVPLRDDYRFRAWVSGEFTLSINGETVLEHADSGRWSEATDEIRLKKGLNEVKARLRSEADRDTAVRLEWSSPDYLFEPIGESQWSHSASDELHRFSMLREGRALFRDLQCGACHLTEKPAGVSSRSGSGVDLSGIGHRRQSDWIARWVENPKSLRSSARMPQLLRSPQAAKDANAVAAFLTQQNPASAELEEQELGDASRGEGLYAALNCGGCHQFGEARDSNDERLWLGNVAAKFYGDSLVSFLIQPNQHHPDIRMPQFGFNRREAQDLAAFLLGDQSVVRRKTATTDDNLVARGREIVGRLGCVNCHESVRASLGDIDSLQPKPITHFDRGCLSAAGGIPNTAPDFALTDTEKQALQLVLQERQESVMREVPLETVQRLQSTLRCGSCHGELQGVPPMEHFGSKLQAAWMNRLFTGQLEYKPRPWLSARMPAFPGFADTLAKGLSHRHGYSHQDPPPVEVDDDLAEIGRQLISPFEGFSCVACHGVGDLKPTQVFESEGINLVYSGERLREEYFRRWILNPIRIDATTKMPVYFDEEGESPLYDVLDGDTDRQLKAMWHYLALGEWMVPPPVE